MAIGGYIAIPGRPAVGQGAATQKASSLFIGAYYLSYNPVGASEIAPGECPSDVGFFFVVLQALFPLISNLFPPSLGLDL